MKITILSYSKTGRNEALALSLASTLSAEHIKIKEKKTRSYFSIVLDILFNRIPKIELKLKDENEILLFVAPVWLGKVAFPLRACLKELQEKPCSYAFISLSGGGDGALSNPGLALELEKRTGRKPEFVMNLHIADFLPANPKPSPGEIEKYQISEKEIQELTDKIAAKVKAVFFKKL